MPWGADRRSSWPPIYALEAIGAPPSEPPPGFHAAVAEHKRIVSQFRCRACGEQDIVIVLRLGNLPLANALRDETGLALPEPRYPLDLAVCRSCSLAQITQTIPADKLFGEYAYFSSFSV